MEMSTSSSKSKVVKIIKWIPAFFILCCSWYLSSQETIEQMPGFWNADKLVHFICFGGFAFWVAFACNIKTAKKWWLPVVIISLYGIIDEFHQSFTPGRETSVLDWLCDTTGAAMGAFVYLFVCLIITGFRKQKDSGSRLCHGKQQNGRE